MAQLLAMASELHPWRFEMEMFSKSVILWTPLQTWGCTDDFVLTFALNRACTHDCPDFCF